MPQAYEEKLEMRRADKVFAAPLVALSLVIASNAVSAQDRLCNPMHGIMNSSLQRFDPIIVGPDESGDLRPSVSMPEMTDCYVDIERDSYTCDIVRDIGKSEGKRVVDQYVQRLGTCLDRSWRLRVRDTDRGYSARITRSDNDPEITVRWSSRKDWVYFAVDRPGY